MDNIQYHKLDAQNMADYLRLRLDCLANHPDEFGTTYEEELNSKSLKLEGAINGPDEYNFVYGAFSIDKKLIGICGCKTETRPKTRHRAEIVQVYVDRQYTKRGIASELLRLTIHAAFQTPLIEQIILSAVTTNQKAMELYKSAGFVEYGRLDHYFKSETGYFTQSFLYLNKPSADAKI